MAYATEEKTVDELVALRAATRVAQKAVLMVV